MRNVWLTWGLLAAGACGCGGDEKQVDGGGADAGRADGGAGPEGGLDAEGPTDAAPREDADVAPDETYDVIVVGAGSGGIGTAIQAARMGASVVILEETDWIGGQMTAAAVTSMDGGNAGPTSLGMYGEFKALITAYYADPVRFPPAGRSVSTCYGGASTCFEPHVGRMILQQMLDTAGVSVRLRTRVLRVRRDGDRVTGVVTSDGRILASAILVDATEAGDVIPLTGARYRAGNSRSDALDLDACIQDITYLAVIRRYAAGVPSALQITAPPPGYTDALRDQFATASARVGGPPALPFGFDWNLQYRGMPDSTNPESYTNATPSRITRTGVNHANDYPGWYVGLDAMGVLRAIWRGVVTARFLEDPAERRRVSCEAKLVTVQFLYYWQTQMDASWSVADDEGFDTPYNIGDNACPGWPAELRAIERHLPVMPYIRESRRIEAMHMLTAREIFRTDIVSASGFITSVASGDYATDLHNCHSDDTLEADLGEDSTDGSAYGNFEVPFESLIPERIDGLLAVEKNLGMTRLATGALRLQPITMLTGQAAGVIAGLAVRDHVEPRALDPLDVQLVLVDAGAAVSRLPFGDVPPGHASWSDVQIVAVRGLMVGNGRDTFFVDRDVTRAEAAVVLATLFALPLPAPPTPTTVSSFDDVPTSHFAWRHVEAMATAGITSGCSPRMFCPASPVTRGQLAVFLSTGLSLPLAPTGSGRFTDAGPLERLIDAVADAGLMDPCGTGLFCPDAPATRGMLARAARRTLAR